MTEFCKLLIEERERRHIKKSEAAELLGVVSDYYCKIEKGYIIPRSEKVLEKYASYLNINIQDLKKIINSKE